MFVYCAAHSTTHVRHRRPPPADRPRHAACAPLVRRRCLSHRVVQRAVDELSVGRAVLHRRGACRRAGAARGRARALRAGGQGLHRPGGHAPAHPRAVQRATWRRKGSSTAGRRVRCARIRQLEGADLRIAVGATAATEHITAILAEYLLSDPASLRGAEPRWVTLWRWHASEETEHRATAFDLYRAMDGNEEWRLRLLRLVTWHFVTDSLRQTVNNLWHDGSFWRARTWLDGWRFLFGRARHRARAGRPVAPLPPRRLPPGAAGRVARRVMVARQRCAVRAGRPAGACCHSSEGHDLSDSNVARIACTVSGSAAPAVRQSFSSSRNCHCT